MGRRPGIIPSFDEPSQKPVPEPNRHASVKPAGAIDGHCEPHERPVDSQPDSRALLACPCFLFDASPTLRESARFASLWASYFDGRHVPFTVRPGGDKGNYRVSERHSQACPVSRAVTERSPSPRDTISIDCIAIKIATGRKTSPWRQRMLLKTQRGCTRLARW